MTLKTQTLPAEKSPYEQGLIEGHARFKIEKETGHLEWPANPFTNEADQNKFEEGFDHGYSDAETSYYS